jgi:uncharacterized protein (TIGR02996 family)
MTISAADRAAFLRAIAETPEDDLPRLVYADWLDERGDPERAEFIRLQCELARLPTDDLRHLALSGRQGELWRACEDVWRPAVPANIRLSPFERGFLTEVTADFNDLEQFPELFSDHPIERLRLHNATSRTARALARGPWLYCVSRLVMTPGRIGNSGLKAIINAKAARRLTELNVSRQAIGDVGAQAIAEAPACADLRTLVLAHNGISDTGAEALAASTRLTALSELDLRGNPIHRDGRALLRARYGSAVSV